MSDSVKACYNVNAYEQTVLLKAWASETYLV
jgi:hypothetical protein